MVCTPHRARLSLVPDALFVKSHHGSWRLNLAGLCLSEDSPVGQLEADTSRELYVCEQLHCEQDAVQSQSIPVGLHP
jgi:hypothetical protein